MPTPPRTDNDAIIKAAHALIETEGPAFSVAALASAVGIKAPSLYKRFTDKAAILAAVEARVITELGETIAAALDEDTEEPVITAARAYRTFALENPGGYGLLFSAEASDEPEVHARRIEALAPILWLLRPATAKLDALPAARFATAFLHGFVTMEIAGAFRMGGDVEVAFEDSLRRLLRGLET